MEIIDQTLTYLIAATALNTTAYIASDSLFNLILLSPSSPIAGASNPLQWKFAKSPLDPSQWWNICTNITLGPFCMDQWGNNASQPALQSPGAFAGQQWTLTPGNGTTEGEWQMQSNYAGPLSFLAGYSLGTGALTMASDAPIDDTYFKFVQVEDANNVASTSTTTSVASATIWTPSVTPTTFPESPAVSATDQQTSKGGLSKGAIAGISVGAVILVLGMVAAAYILWRMKRRKRPASERPLMASELANGSDNLETQRTALSPSRTTDDSSLMTPATEASLPSPEETVATAGTRKTEMAQRIHELPAREIRR